MAFKMTGFSPFTKDPKLSKKRIIKATDIKVEGDKLLPTENLESDFSLIAGTGKVKGGSVNVYRKGTKKYVKDDDSGEFTQLTRSEIKRLKKEGSYTSVRKIKKEK